MIELCNKDLKKSIFDDIMFFSFAESGAMGSPGEVLFINKKGQTYCFNYVLDDVDMKKVRRFFPVLSDCKFGIDYSQVPNGWNYVDLGAGNHLLVRDEVYSKFVELLKGENRPHIIYGKWGSIADSIINENCHNMFGNLVSRSDGKEENTISIFENSIELIKGSCIDQIVDVVVNAANSGLWAGDGVCGAIFEKAGMIELTEACKKHRTPLHDGEAVITPAFNIKNAKAIIHAVGPNFSKNPKAFKELFDAYYNSLIVMKDNGYHSISFPLISSGIFSGSLAHPSTESTKQCCKAYKKFIEDYPKYFIDVKVCAFSEMAMESASKVFKAEALDKKSQC